MNILHHIQVAQPQPQPALRVAPAQKPQLLNNNPTLSPYLPGLTPDNPYKIGAWPAHDYAGLNGMPVHMPAYPGHGWLPTPLARPLPPPTFTQFNKMQRL